MRGATGHALSLFGPGARTRTRCLVVSRAWNGTNRDVLSTPTGDRVIINRGVNRAAARRGRGGRAQTSAGPRPEVVAWCDRVLGHH